MVSQRQRDALGTARPHSRRSLAHVPSSFGNEAEKENATIDAAAMASSKPPGLRSNGGSSRKLRSKSMGPGGLDSLSESALNLPRVVLPLPPPLLPLCKAP